MLKGLLFSLIVAVILNILVIWGINNEVIRQEKINGYYSQKIK